ncbi:3130_t:CDS:2 [Cetraspora pellucida]|uniref:3130_t:CDS:1 n=1 Tax=Cetraspora pellucida TaxID=1433469 RepID=A0A9N9BLR8_9GLOM|nr:3130_t:CDS:2 [Cetraspora pellucida]
MLQKSKNKIASFPKKSPSSAGECSERMSNYLLNFDKQGPTSTQNANYPVNINGILRDIPQDFQDAATRIANEENNDTNYYAKISPPPTQNGPYNLQPTQNRTYHPRQTPNGSQPRDVNYCNLYDNEAEEKVYMSTQHHHQPYTTNRKERLEKRTEANWDERLCSRVIQEPSQEAQPTQLISMKVIDEEQTLAQPQQAREDKIGLPQDYGSDEDNFFDNYEEEDIEEVESYHTDDTLSEGEELYTNSWEDVYSLAIYLTTLEEIPTSEEPKEIPRNKNCSQNSENPGYNTEENEKCWTEKENYYCNTINEWLEKKKTLTSKEPGKANRAKFIKKQLKLPYWEPHHEQTQAAQVGNELEKKMDNQKTMIDINGYLTELTDKDEIEWIPTVHEEEINPTGYKNLNEFVSWRTRDRSYIKTEKFWANIGNYYYDSEVDERNDDDEDSSKEPITTPNEYWQDPYEEVPNIQEMYDLEEMKELNADDYKTVRPNIPPSDQESCETW